MRILYDGLIYSTQAAGGINRYFANIIGRLPAADSAILTTPSIRPVNFPCHPNLEIHVPARVHPKVLAPLTRPIQLRRLQSRLSFDIIHPTYYVLLTWKNLRRVGVPVVVTIWDMTHERFRRQLDPTGLHAYTKRRAVEAADALLCISSNTRDDLLAYYDVQPERVHVIPLATDMSASQRQDASLVPPQPFFLFVGSRAEYKNFDLLLRALRSIHSDDVVLCVVGAPLTRKEQLRLVDLGISSRVLALGHATDTQLAALYARSVALVYPSRYEGFGIPPLEAMACGGVAITSNTSSIPEVVGNAALTFNPNSLDELVDHLRSVISRPGLRLEMVRRGRERAKTFSWDRTARETFAVYRSLLSPDAAEQLGSNRVDPQTEPAPPGRMM